MQENKGKLVILGVLMRSLAIVGLLLSRKANDPGKQIAGTSFSLMTSIYDLKTPLGVAVDGDNKIYVSDTIGVRVLDKAGNYLYSLNPPPEAVQDAPGLGTARPNMVSLYK